DDEAFDVVGDAVISAFDKGECLGGAEQRKRTARAYTQLERIGFSRRVDDLEQVIDERLIKTHASDQSLKLDDIRLRHNVLDTIERICTLAVAKYLALVVETR